VAPRSRGHRREHRIRSVDRRRVVVRQLDLDLRHVDRAQDAEGPDREVQRHAVEPHRDALAAHPSERHVGRTDAVGPQDDLVEHAAAADAHVDEVIADLGAGDGTRRRPHLVDVAE
jgi:hypothetical protein